MKKVKLFGQEYNMAINFYSLIEYERATGDNSLDPKRFVEGKLEPIMQLAHAMIVGNNDKAPDYDELLRNPDMEEMSELVQVTCEIYLAFISPKGGDGDGKQKKGEGKNA